MSERLYATFHVGDTFFGVDATDVQEVMRTQPMSRVPLASSEISGLINLRGQIVVAIDLRQRLHVDHDEWETEPLNVVVRTEQGPVALIVDEIGDVLEANDEELESPPETLSPPTKDLVTAVMKLEERLLLVLDVTAAASPEAAAA